jgi:hypothetical protein
MTKLSRAKRNDDTAATPPPLPEIDSTPETRRSSPATAPTRGGAASAANRRQTRHGRAKDDGRGVSRSGSKKGGKYDRELERLNENFSQSQEQLFQEKAIK